MYKEGRVVKDSTLAADKSLLCAALGASWVAEDDPRRCIIAEHSSEKLNLHLSQYILIVQL